MPKIRSDSLAERVKSAKKLSVSDIAVLRYFNGELENFRDKDIQIIKELLYKVIFLKVEDFLSENTQEEMKNQGVLPASSCQQLFS